MRIRTPSDWPRALIMFVVAWLVAVYVYETVQTNVGAVPGVVLAVGTFVINGYARVRAMRSVDRAGWQFHFWSAMPLLLLVIVPAIVKTIAYFRAHGDAPWYSYVVPLLPLLLKLGVPVVALLIVYVLLWRRAVRNRGPDDSVAAHAAPVDAASP
jgi:hypothetical protein